MFTNIGAKLKTLAVVIAAIGIIASVVFAITIWVSAGHVSSYRSSYYGYYSYSSSFDLSSILGALGFWGGLIALVVGCLVSWIGSWSMYAFGSLVEDMSATRFAATDIRMLLEKKGRSNGNSELGGKTRCPSCDTLNDSSNTTCKACGKPLAYKALQYSPASAPAAPHANKKCCPTCGAYNNLSNTECFACNTAFPQ